MKYRDIELVEYDGIWYFENRELSEAGDDYPHSDKLELWTKANNVTRAKGYIFCLGKVLYGRSHACPHYFSPYPRNERPLCAIMQKKSHEWFDHPTMFWQSERKQYILTAQPYNVSLEKFQEMEAVAAKYGLSVHISLKDAWHYPGRTPLIVWRKAESA